MKRKWLLLTMYLCLGAALAGCGKKDTGSTGGSVSVSSSSSVSASSEEALKSAEIEPEELPIVEGDYDLAECITLGDYKGLTLEKKVREVTEADIDENVELALMQAVEDLDSTVQEGDMVDIAYEGKLDGVPFEGGSSDSYNLEIGSHTFIDGFEEGIIGMKREETKDLNLKFPEDYRSEELAGKEVVFTVTVNMISRPQEISDAWVAENSEYSTVEEYRQSIRTELEENNRLAAESELEAGAVQTVMANAEMHQLPREFVDLGEEMYDAQWEIYATASEMSLEEYIEANIGTEQYEATKEQYGKEVGRIFLLLQAVGEAEGWSEEDMDYQDRLNTYVDNSGLTRDEFIAQNNMESIRLSILLERLTDLVLDNATVTEVIVDANGNPVE